MENKDLGVAPAAQPPLSHPSGAEPVPVSGKAGIANARHTPGPWSLGPAAVVLGADGRRVCQLAVRIDDTDVADARLIAAAPEMFEALLLVLAGYTKLGPFDEPLGGSEQTPAINAARAAVRKALGQ